MIIWRDFLLKTNLKKLRERRKESEKENYWSIGAVALLLVSEHVIGDQWISFQSRLCGFAFVRHKAQSSQCSIHPDQNFIKSCIHVEPTAKLSLIAAKSWQSSLITGEESFVSNPQCTSMLIVQEQYFSIQMLNTWNAPRPPSQSNQRNMSHRSHLQFWNMPAGENIDGTIWGSIKQQWLWFINTLSIPAFDPQGPLTTLLTSLDP